jgi:hypothetical protein
MYLRFIPQYQSPPRPKVVLCHSPTYEAEPKYLGLYVIGEPYLLLYTVLKFAITVAGRHRRHLRQLAVQA